MTTQSTALSLAHHIIERATRIAVGLTTGDEHASPAMCDDTRRINRDSHDLLNLLVVIESQRRQKARTALPALAPAAENKVLDRIAADVQAAPNVCPKCEDTLSEDPEVTNPGLQSERKTGRTVLSCSCCGYQRVEGKTREEVAEDAEYLPAAHGPAEGELASEGPPRALHDALRSYGGRQFANQAKASIKAEGGRA